MNKKAVSSVIFAGVLWGVISIFINKLSAAGFDSMQISCVRMTSAALLFTAVVLIENPSMLKIKLRDIWMFIGTGIISVALFNTCYFYTIINSQASVAVVLLYTSPVFIMLLSAVIFKEKITFKKIIALILTFAGCVCVSGVIGGGYKLTPFVLLIGLCSGLFYGLYTIFGRFALKKYDTMTVTAYTFIFAMLGSLPLGKLDRTIEIVKAEPTIIIWCIGINVISTVLPYFFYTWGLQRMESSKAAILVAVEPLVGAVIGMTVFHEAHNAVKIFGIVAILTAIVILNLPQKNQSKKFISDD